MIRYIENSDLFLSKADALVNPVNCKGLMGQGLALEFKKRFPECVKPYKTAVASGKLHPRTLLYVHLIVQPDLFSTKRPAVILFPTKDHWRDKSKIEWINKGLLFLRDHYRQWQINSIALPQIGCGLGGLPWTEVKQLIEQYLCNEPVDVEVYVEVEKVSDTFSRL
jgi:O-acetyl-ADP-ribose deacetylase (regulator of RNase III)